MSKSDSLPNPNLNDFELRRLLQKSNIIATVGFSTDEDKPSHNVPAYLLEHGYHVIPVNPKATEILGQKAYPDLLAIPEKIDLVQIFRPSSEVPLIVEQAIQIGANAIWMQLDIENEQAAQHARDAGLAVVMNRCMRVEHIRLIGA